MWEESGERWHNHVVCIIRVQGKEFSTCNLEGNICCIFLFIFIYIFLDTKYEVEEQTTTVNKLELNSTCC